LPLKRGDPDAFPFRAMMGGAIAYLHWTADQFWASTMHELQSAMDSIAEANAAGSEG
jgi:hypothetical protein